MRGRRPSPRNLADLPLTTEATEAASAVLRLEFGRQQTTCLVAPCRRIRRYSTQATVTFDQLLHAPVL